jgi:hypothetical protein
MDQRPKTPEAYVELINQAIFEIEDLRAAAEYDMDSMGGAMSFLDELEGHMKAMRKKMEDGVYRFEDRDLPFMAVVEKYSDSVLPFKYLLRMINATHRMGLNVDDEA